MGSGIRVKSYLVPKLDIGREPTPVERLEIERLFRSAFKLAPAERKRFAGLLAKSAASSNDEVPIEKIVP